MNGLTICVFILAITLANTAQGQQASPPYDNWEDLQCMAKCAFECHAKSKFIPVFCISKCVIGCLGSSSPSDALFGCTLDCANSTTSTLFTEEKPVESEEDFKLVGEKVGHCYGKCKNEMLT